MTAGYDEIMETISAVYGLPIEEKCQRVGLDADGVQHAAESLARCTIASFDTTKDFHDELLLSLAVVFCTGITIGARLAQAGLAQAEPVIA